MNWYTTYCFAQVLPKTATPNMSTIVTFTAIPEIAKQLQQYVDSGVTKAIEINGDNITVDSEALIRDTGQSKNVFNGILGVIRSADPGLSNDLARLSHSYDNYQNTKNQNAINLSPITDSLDRTLGNIPSQLTNTLTRIVN